MVSEIVALNLLKDAFRINNGGLFWLMLKKQENYHFFQTKVRNAKNAYFEPDYDTIFWSEFYTCNQCLNQEGLEYYEFIIGVRISGDLNEFNNKGITFSSLAVEFDFTIHAFVFKDWNSISEDKIKLLNTEQKLLLLFSKNYEKEVEKIKVKLLSEYTYLNEEAFTFFSRIWKLVDPLDLRMVNNTSLDFFGELVECHRNIRYSVGCANIWGRYTTHYSNTEYTFQGEKVYPVGLNYHDYRYFFYVENAIEEIYTFYERLSYLLYIFLKPVSFDIHSLSFNKLFDRKTRKEVKTKYQQLSNDLNFDWFTKRYSKEHKKLSNYRHPLNHYKSDNSFIKGAYSASYSRIWMDNASGNEQELTQLFKDFSEIKVFINQELINCKEAFERTILLIENLQ